MTSGLSVSPFQPTPAPVSFIPLSGTMIYFRRLRERGQGRVRMRRVGDAPLRRGKCCVGSPCAWPSRCTCRADRRSSVTTKRTPACQPSPAHRTITSNKPKKHSYIGLKIMSHTTANLSMSASACTTSTSTSMLQLTF